jgi:hypothetical protein
MNAYVGVDVYIHEFLTSALAAGEWSASRPGPGERAPGTHWIGGGVGRWRGEKLCPYRDSSSDPSAIQPVASRYTDCAIPDPGGEIATLLNPLKLSGNYSSVEVPLTLQGAM